MNDIVKRGQILPPETYEPEKYPFKSVPRPPQGATRLSLINTIRTNIRRRETEAWNNYVEETEKTKRAYHDLAVAEKELTLAVDYLLDKNVNNNLANKRWNDWRQSEIDRMKADEDYEDAVLRAEIRKKNREQLKAQMNMGGNQPTQETQQPNPSPTQSNNEFFTEMHNTLANQLVNEYGPVESWTPEQDKEATRRIKELDDLFTVSGVK